MQPWAHEEVYPFDPIYPPLRANNPNNMIRQCLFQPVPEGEHGLLMNEEQIQDLRIKRNKRRLPQSLNALAMKSVYKSLTCFIDVPDSPLKYLPNTIVQQLLSKIASDFKKEKLLIPPPQLMQVLGLLLNPFVTELDCTVFESTYSKDQKFNNYLYKHALENCPKIREIKLRGDVGDGFDLNHLDDDHEPLPVECFKKSWNNLTTIICQKYFICNEDTMMFLQENFPNIEVLTVCLVITASTAQTVLDHLINMKRLHTLKLDVVADSESCQVIPNFIIDVAGAVPSLRYFDFKGDWRNDSKFIDLFGEKYPYKKLMVDELRMEEGLKRKWPKNLSVKHLTIHGYWSEIEIENLSTIECTLDLTVNCKMVRQMYQVLDCIGGLVKSLSIDDRPGEMNVEFDTEFILERVLAACPNLENFELDTDMPVVRDPNYNLPPAAFKNYKSFVIIDWEVQYQVEVVLQQVFQNFLIGTDVCESLEYLHYKQLQTIAQVALAYPERLQKLRVLHIKPSTFSSYFGFDFYDKLNEDFYRYDEVFYKLLTCCNKLDKIFLLSHRASAREGTRVNSYLATIYAIDPHFLEKLFQPK